MQQKREIQHAFDVICDYMEVVHNEGIYDKISLKREALENLERSYLED
jgi:hypothetical protein